jgi:putative tricarboxylic transport membrane protein
MSDNVHPAGDGPSHRSVEIGTAVAMLLFAAITIYGSLQVGINWGAEGPRAGFFPFYVAVMIALASVYNLARVFIDGAPGLFAEWSQLRQVLAVIVPTTVYVFILPWIGLYIASILLIAVFMRWLGRYGWPMVAAVSVGTMVATYLMFEKWFLVPLPKGPIEDWLGL